MATLAKTTDSPAPQPAVVPAAGVDCRPMRADARRNRDRVVAAARDLFARIGTEAGMEEIAATAGVGVGTVYRHFPTKTALLTALVARRFADMTALAEEVERTDRGGAALLTLLRRQADSVATDKGFQLTAMGWEGLDPAEIDPEVARLREVTRRLVERAVAAGEVRADLDFEDVGMLMCGLTAVMYFKPHLDWRRHLELTLSGLRPDPTP